MSQMPPTGYAPAGPMGSMQPHRGTLILVLGILGIVLCFICGIFAWVMGNTDLKAMDAGRMDPTGRGITNAGRICGMIGTIIACVGVLVYCGIAALGLAGVAAGAASGAGGP